METTPLARSIWVLPRADGPTLFPSGRQLLATARALADQGGMPVVAVLLGPPSPTSHQLPTQEAIAYGADRLVLLEDAQLGRYDVASFTAALAAYAAAAPPALVLLPDDRVGRDLAPRLAYALGAGLIVGADATTLEIDPYTHAPAATVRRWAGRLLTTYVGSGDGPTVITLAAGAAMEPYYDDWRYGDSEVVDLASLGVAWPADPPTIASAGEPVMLDGPPSTDDWHPQVAAWRALAGARVVVVGGVGLGSPEAFALVPQLAQALGGEWGATGEAIEQGWAPPEREVGIRGASVRPTFYLGLGVHGSPEHVVAMQGARLIAAVHPDPAAPLFRWATWGIVADPALFAAALLERVQRET